MTTLFKSARAYRIVNSESLQDLSRLNEFPVQECAPGQISKIGWENPFDKEAESAAYELDNYTIICMVIVQKVIKAAAINRETAKNIKILEKQEGRPISRKERLQIKDDVIAAALPSALSEEKRIYGYIDWQNNMLIVDQHSINKCDLFTSELRKALGSLSIVPLRPANMPEMVMNSWVKDNASPPDIELMGDAVFKNPTDLSQTARIRHAIIDGHGVSGLLEDGMIPQEVSLKWSISDTSSMTFKLSDSVTIKSIKFSDELIAIDNEYDDAEDQFTISMIINCNTISSAIKMCFGFFGGFYEE